MPGLIGEFLSRVEDREHGPGSSGTSIRARTTSRVRSGCGPSNLQVEQQIGRFIDGSRPPLEVEAQPRRRVFVAPERWRVGASPFPTADHLEVR